MRRARTTRVWPVVFGISSAAVGLAVSVDAAAVESRVADAASDPAPAPAPAPAAAGGGDTPMDPAADGGDKWDGGYDISYERRSDFMFSVTGGFVLGVVSGYPNDVDKIDQPAYEASTGAAPGYGGTAIIGLAFRDWLGFGIGLHQSKFSGGGHAGSALLFLFRTEAYPFYEMGAVGKDLGLAVTGGLGVLKLEHDGEKSADGGAASVVGLGAFWEGLQFGQISLGPALDYQYVFSTSISGHLTTLGLRGVFYGGP